MGSTTSARTYNQYHVSAQIHSGQTPSEHLLDVELPVGISARSCGHGESFLYDDRSANRAVAELRDARI